MIREDSSSLNNISYHFIPKIYQHIEICCYVAAGPAGQLRRRRAAQLGPVRMAPLSVIPKMQGKKNHMQRMEHTCKLHQNVSNDI